MYSNSYLYVANVSSKYVSEMGKWEKFELKNSVWEYLEKPKPRNCTFESA